MGLYQAVTDLLRQVANTLQPQHGGTGSTYGEQRTVVRAANSIGSNLPLYTAVQWSTGANDGRVVKVTATSSQFVLGSVVGYYGGDGVLLEADAPDGYEVAVQTAGVARFLIESNVTRGHFAFSAATDGFITSSAAMATGAFGIVITSASTTAGHSSALVSIPIAAGGAGGSGFATPAIVLSTAAAAGAAGTVIRSDSTIAAFDATVPVTQAFSDAAATGSVAFAARRDHTHGMPAAFDATVPVTQAFSDAAATGSAVVAARRDHKHGMPADPTGGGGGIASGSAFPGSPATNDIFRRTDLGLLCYYNGTRWLTLNQYVLQLSRVGDGTEPATASKGAQYWDAAGEVILIEEFYLAFFVSGGGSALSGSHKWAVVMALWDSSGAQGAAIATVTIDSGSSSVFRQASVTGLSTVSNASDTLIGTSITKTGTPGSLYNKGRVHYRRVVT